MSAAPAEVVPVELSTLVGSTTPRVFTRPLVDGVAGECGCGCALSRDSSYGFAVDDFARLVLCQPLDPWQRWLVVHAGELLPDGRPRFRKILTIVARQCGKTHLLVVLSLFWLFVDRVPMILGTSTQIKYARESWAKVVKTIKATPELSTLLPPTRNQGIRQANGEQEVAVLRSADSEIEDTCRYLIAAANEEGGRSLSVDRLILDELRQHHDYSAWDALLPTTSARPDAQVWAISNQGGERSVVLHDLRREAMAWIEHGDGDRRLGLFEWSAEPAADPDDVSALLQAVPAIGVRQDLEALLADARAAIRTGGRKLVGWRTEILCQMVTVLDPAVDPDGWGRCLDPGDLSGARSRVALCLDVSLDAQHATLVAAAVLDDGRVRVEVVRAWSGPGCTRELEMDLPELVARVKPRTLGWFPAGPAAAVAVAVRQRPGWPPRGVRVEALRQEAADVCMGLASAVTGGLVAHSGDPLLDAHVSAAEPLRTGDRWVFTRRGGGHVDAAYAVAGAVHLARSAPQRVRSTRGFVAGDVRGE